MLQNNISIRKELNMEDTKLFETAVVLCIDAYRQTEKKNLLKKIFKDKKQINSS